MENLRTISLLAAVITMGISAGVYKLYYFVIMPGLSKTDDRTFVGAFQQIDKAIVGPYLIVFFVGALVFTALAAVFHVGIEEGTTLLWIVGALVLQLVIVATTIVVNVPLNNAIKDAGSPNEIIDLAGVRKRFNERRWINWNHIRVVTSTIAFVALAWALVLDGRS